VWKPGNPRDVEPVEREADRHKLHGLLRYHKKVILFGMGGSGKTHLAFDLRNQVKEEWRDLFLDASTETTLFHGMASILELLAERGFFSEERLGGMSPQLTTTLNRCRRRHVPGEQDGVGEVHRDDWARLLAFHVWVRLNMEDLADETLLIFDNVADAATLNGMLSDLYSAAELATGGPGYLREDPEFQNLPGQADGATKLRQLIDYTVVQFQDGRRTAGRHLQQFGGQVLVIMNHAPEDEDGFKSFEMPKCSHSDAVKMLSRHAGDPKLSAPNDPNVEQLLRLLDHFPLAIAKAGSLIHDGNYSAEQYKDRLIPAIAEFQDATETLDIRVRTKKPHLAVGATVELTRQAVHSKLKDERAREAAECALNICAYLACDGIPADLLCLAPSGYDKEPASQSALQQLEVFRLLRQEPEKPGFYHVIRVVQEVLRARVRQLGQPEQWLNEALQRVSRRIPLRSPTEMNADEWRRFHELRPHAQECLRQLGDLLKREKANAVEADGWPSEDAYREYATKHKLISEGLEHPLHTFMVDQRIHRWIIAGDWEAIIKGQESKGEADDLSYEDMYVLETPAGRERLERQCASLWRSPHSTEALIAVGCIYFAPHYWWTEYMPSHTSDICLPVLSALEASVHHESKMPPGRPHPTASPHGESDDQEVAQRRQSELVSALHRFHKNYPRSYEYHERTTERKQEWAEALEALKTVREVVNLAGDAAPVSNAQRFLKSITNIYLAAAQRYAKGHPLYRGLDHPDIWKLYEKAEEFLSANGDHMHHAWVAYERAEARKEAGEQCLSRRLFLPPRREKASEHFTEALRMCVEARKGAIELRLPRRGANMTEDPKVDRELIFNSYAIEGEIAWLERNLSKAWGCYCAASYAALAFVESDRDDYARHGYHEIRKEILSRVRHLLVDRRYDELARACALLYGFWNVDGTDPHQGYSFLFGLRDDTDLPDLRTVPNKLLQEKIDRDLLPATPRLADLRPPGGPKGEEGNGSMGGPEEEERVGGSNNGGAAIAPSDHYLAYLQSLLRKMPGRMEQLRRTYDLKEPADFYSSQEGANPEPYLIIIASQVGADDEEANADGDAEGDAEGEEDEHEE
jgi:hypothetical protein